MTIAEAHTKDAEACSKFLLHWPKKQAPPTENVVYFLARWAAHWANKVLTEGCQ